MTINQKCRSQKRNPNGGGCGDPQCPEGPNHAAEKAVENADMNAYLAAREEMSVIATPMAAPLLRSGGLPRRPIGLPRRPIGLPGSSPQERVAKIDKTIIPSYPDVPSMEEGLRALYSGYGYVILSFVQEGDLKMVAVEEMDVKRDFRGMGIGRHMRASILKFADENDCIVAGTPSQQGDGTVKFGEEGYHENCLTHQQRLEKFYLDSGYEYNYAFKQFSNNLTGEPLPKNPEWVEQFNPQAIGMLMDSGWYVRWPKNTIPDNWKA